MLCSPTITGKVFEKNKNKILKHFLITMTQEITVSDIEVDEGYCDPFREEVGG